MFAWGKLVLSFPYPLADRNAIFKSLRSLRSLKSLHAKTAAVLMTEVLLLPETAQWILTFSLRDIVKQLGKADRSRYYVFDGTGRPFGGVR